MADNNQLKQAQTAFKTMREMFDAKGLKYDVEEENLTIYSGAVGDDLPVSMRIRVDVERMLIVMHSHMPFEVPENRRLEMAVAVSRANFGLPDGSFDYDFMSGNIVYRLTCCYRDSLIGQELFEYMFLLTFGIVDEYNDLLEKIATSDMSIDQIIETVK